MVQSAFVSKDCHTKYPRLVAKTTEIYFLTVLEAGSPRLGYQHGQVLAGEGSLPGLPMSTFSCCTDIAFPQCMSMQRESALVSFPSYKYNNSVRIRSHSLRYRTSTYECTGDTIRSITFCPWLVPQEFMSLLHAKFIHSIPTTHKVLTHFSINCKVLSPKSYLNMI